MVRWRVMATGQAPHPGRPGAQPKVRVDGTKTTGSAPSPSGLRLNVELSKIPFCVREGDGMAQLDYSNNQQ